MTLDTEPAIGSAAFIRGAARCLEGMPPIIGFAILKQLNDLNVAEAAPRAERMTPDLAKQFIARMTAAIRAFAPPEKAEEVRRDLLREFRRAYPEGAGSRAIETRMIEVLRGTFGEFAEETFIAHKSRVSAGPGSDVERYLQLALEIRRSCDLIGGEQIGEEVYRALAAIAQGT